MWFASAAKDGDNELLRSLHTFCFIMASTRSDAPVRRSAGAGASEERVDADPRDKEPVDRFRGSSLCTA